MTFCFTLMPFTGNGPATKSDEFLEKCQGGGGVIFNPKTYIADFGNFKQGFLIMKLIQNRNFKVQGMLFSTIVLYYNCITPISGNHMHAFHTIWPSHLLAYMQTYPL